MKHPKSVVVKYIAVVDGEHRARSISCRYDSAHSMEANIEYAKGLAVFEDTVFCIGSVVLKY